MPQPAEEIFEHLDAIFEDVSHTFDRVSRAAQRIMRLSGKVVTESQEPELTATTMATALGIVLPEFIARKVSHVRVGDKFYSVSVIEIPDPKLKKQERNHTV